MSRSSLALLALLAAVPARAGGDAVVATPATAPNAAYRPVPGMPAASSPAGLAAPGTTLGLQPLGADLRLDPAVQASMANPVPVTAMGLRPEYFTLQLDQAQAQAAAAAAPALASGRVIAASAAPSAGAAVTTVSAHVYDGDSLSRTSDAAAPAEAPKPSKRAHPLAKTLADADRLASAGFKPIGEESARRALFAAVDRVKVKGKPGVRDAISGTFIDDGAKMKVDLAWPADLGPTAAMSSDLHVLLPVLEGAKSERLPDAAKGRMARAMLYAYARYRDRGALTTAAQKALWNGRIAMLLDWNRRFPPSDEEKQRNAIAAVEQGNRNPFIDDPALAGRIGEAALRR